MDDLIKELKFYRGPEKQWQWDIYGFYPRGLGDLISNTMSKIIDDNDTSDWAFDALLACSDLLLERKRWPDYMQQNVAPYIAPNWLRWKISQFSYNQCLSENQLYRPQQYMTRDPYIYFFACCVHLNKKQFIEFISIPIKLYRPEVWEWKKALLGQKNNYEKWREFNKRFEKKDYVQKLDFYMYQAYQKTLLTNK